MIVIEVTPQVNQALEKPYKLLIVAESLSVLDIDGKTNFNSCHLERGCRIMDGKHNNGGWKVEESYAEVKEMIMEQLMEKALDY